VTQPPAPANDATAPAAGAPPLPAALKLLQNGPELLPPPHSPAAAPFAAVAHMTARPLGASSGRLLGLPPRVTSQMLLPRLTPAVCRCWPCS
jgi:hypothetical protein